MDAERIAMRVAAYGVMANRPPKSGASQTAGARVSDAFRRVGGAHGEGDLVARFIADHPPAIEDISPK